MDITYLGHSAFKLRGKNGSVVTDPYDNSVGFSMPKVSADLVTVSHEHDDHNAVQKVSASTRRDEVYAIRAPGEYEISEIGVFGWGSYHDNQKGEERGKNTIFVLHIDGIRVVHLGDLGHVLDESLEEDIGDVDVLLVPVGGVYTINAAEAAEVVRRLQPGFVIPMHYKTDSHNAKTFGELDGVEAFLKEMSAEEAKVQDKFTVPSLVPEETEVVWLSA
jgi:L-ascorbate metabolism protein UlaG (beta-lactamase superfamily)